MLSIVAFFAGFSLVAQFDIIIAVFAFLVAGVFGFFAYRIFKHVQQNADQIFYVLRIRTSSGEVDGYVHKDAKIVQEIEKALDKAIAYR